MLYEAIILWVYSRLYTLIRWHYTELCSTKKISGIFYTDNELLLRIFLLLVYYLRLMLDKHAFACFFLSPCASLSYAAHVLSICRQHVFHTCLLLMFSSLSTYLSPYVHHTLSIPMPCFLTVYLEAYRVVYTSASLCSLITRSLLAQHSNETL